MASIIYIHLFRIFILFVSTLFNSEVMFGCSHSLAMKLFTCSVGKSSCFSKMISATGSCFYSSPLVPIELIVCGFGWLNAPVPAGANGFNGLKPAARGFVKLIGFIGKPLLTGADDSGFPIVYGSESSWAAGFGFGFGVSPLCSARYASSSSCSSSFS